MRFIMVDEYQDTSRIQQEILLRLANAHGNLAVGGDDDQAIYRFRGASVRDLLQFPEWFPNAEVVGLTVNYRSHVGIVEAYSLWMPSAADWAHPTCATFHSAMTNSSPPTRRTPTRPTRRSSRYRARRPMTRVVSWGNCSGF